MASSIPISLIIKGVNQTGNAFRQIQSNFQGMAQGIRAAQQQAQKAGGQTNQYMAASAAEVGNAVATATAKMQLAFGVAQRGFQFVQNKIQGAMQVELENLSSASGLSEMMGGFDEAASFIDNLNASLSKAAAALPGATAEYSALARAITDDVGLAFKGASGKIEDMDTFEETLSSIATSYTALGASSGINAGAMNMAVVRMMGGASEATLHQLEAFENSPQLKNALSEALKAEGVASLGDLEQAKRIELIKQVGESIMTPEFLSRSQDTLDGLMQGFISDIFDPQGGVFGVLRKIENTVGVHTVYDAAKMSIRNLIGSDGLYGILKRIAGLVDLVDPMEVVYDGFMFLNNNVFAPLNKALSNVADVAEIGGISAGIEMLMFYLGEAFNIEGLSVDTIGEAVAGFINGIIQGFESMIGGGKVDASGVGGIGGIIINEILDAVSGIDYGAIFMIGSHISRFIIEGITSGIIGLFANMDMSTYATIIGGLVMTHIVTTAVIPAIATLGSSIMGAMGIASATAPVLLIAAAALAVGMLIKSIYDNRDAVIALIAEVWNGIRSSVGDFFRLLSGSFDLMIGIITLDGEKVVGGVQKMLDAIKRLIQRVTDAVARFVPGMSTSGQVAAQQSMDSATEKLEGAGTFNITYKNAEGQEVTEQVDRARMEELIGEGGQYVAAQELDREGNRQLFARDSRSGQRLIEDEKIYTLPEAANTSTPQTTAIPIANTSTPQTTAIPIANTLLAAPPQAAGGILPSTRLGQMIGAIINEGQSSGASPVIANASEAILNQGQQQSLLGGIMGRSPSTPDARPPVTVNATINVNGAGNPQAVANEVLMLLETKLRERLSNQIA